MTSLQADDQKYMAFEGLIQWMAATALQGTRIHEADEMVRVELRK